MGAWLSLNGERYDDRRLPVREERVRVPLLFLLLGVIGRALVRVVAATVFRPGLWVPLVLVIVVVRAMGLAGLSLGVTVVAGGLLAWSLLHSASYQRFVHLPTRAVRRHLFVYRLGWQPAMVTCRLDIRIGQRQYLPKLVRVRSTRSVDRVRVRMLPGQLLEDYAEQAERLATTLGAVECRVRSGKQHGEVELWFLVEDPLRRLVPGFDANKDGPDYTRLPVALREDSETYRLRLIGNHVLVVGATGSGKGSVLWSIVSAIHPGLLAGSAQLWVLDPKGGMEFAPGARLFHRYSYGDPESENRFEARTYELAFACFLEDAVAIMRQRQSELRGVTRLHEPTPDSPLIVIVVDELASLTAYATDRDARNRIKAALSLLLSQGRAVGVVVVAALQDPRKDVLPFRDLFPTRVALRLTEPEQVDMTLGDGARRRGARCDLISELLPGVGYVVIDGVAEPVRVRFPYISDEQIEALAATAPSAFLVKELQPTGGEAA
ncbi:MAG: hypothetical protein J2P22_03065 [Nocardioides sp.]|nr:hypothetical protein [Nocardioides sp.]